MLPLPPASTGERTKVSEPSALRLYIQTLLFAELAFTKSAPTVATRKKRSRTQPSPQHCPWVSSNS